MFNDTPCGACRGIQQVGASVDRRPLAEIREGDTVVRGGERFFVCPACRELFAVKAVPDALGNRYVLRTSEGTGKHQWMVDAPGGGRQRVRVRMTEEEAHMRYSNPERAPATAIH